MKKSNKSPAEKVLERFAKKVSSIDIDSNEMSSLKKEVKDLENSYKERRILKSEMKEKLARLKSKLEDIIIGI